MEYVRASNMKGFPCWQPTSDSGTFTPHSAPSTCGFLTSQGPRATSLPLCHGIALPSALKVRSQSESAGLNKLNFKVPSGVLIKEMLVLHKNVYGHDEVQFFSRSQPEPSSDSDGDDSGTSSDSGHTSEHDMVTEFNDSTQFDESFNDTRVAFPSLKKSVRFADDCGAPLELVRILTEPSDIPPRISPSVIRRYRRASKQFAAAQARQHNSSAVLSADEDSSDDEEDELYHNKKHASWKIGFIQPASEYVKFRESLEKNKVALENVMLRNDHCKMLGTIKVGNIAFNKNVFVRFTSDGWKSYLDRPATYQASSSKVYDTFAFEIDIPMNEGDVNQLEFCICFATDEGEHWDSNNGKNYIIVSENTPIKPHQAETAASQQRLSVDTDDAYRMNYDNWTRFASWRNLSTAGPYW
uniref:CBM21 domain-containing protein n=1 Tax=Panagrellus redivivus TaxID=6233 RepID=A0A7E4UXJ9_PANRE